MSNRTYVKQMPWGQKKKIMCCVLNSVVYYVKGIAQVNDG